MFTPQVAGGDTGGVPGDAVLVEVKSQGGAVGVVWSDGLSDAVTATWLRHACRCAECCGTSGGQRRFDVAGVPAGLGLAAIRLDGSDVATEFTDGHHGTVPAAAFGRRRPRPGRPRWGAEHGDHLRSRAVGWSRDPAPFLDDLDRFGVAMVVGGPVESGSVVGFADRIGFVRETNYGRLFDVVAEPDPANLANSELGLPVHTDNPYRDPVPTVQLLHCIRSAGEGGATLLVDGFAAAERLAAREPGCFELLVGTDVPFRFADASVDLRAAAPLIALDSRGDVVAVRVNSRSMEPPDLPHGEIDRFYDAYREFVAELASPAASVELTLAPGELLAVDNRRTLHGRRAYGAGGRRWLQGCYIDVDAVRSAVLVREAASA